MLRAQPVLLLALQLLVPPVQPLLGQAAPSGSCTGTDACAVGSLVAAGSVSSDAASGQYALRVLESGAFIGMGTHVSERIFCDGTGVCETSAQLNARGGINMKQANISDAATNRPVVVNDPEGFKVTAQALPSCSSTYRDVILPDGSVGANTGTAARLCYCRSDGSNGWTWRNLMNPSAPGTATTCPD